MRPERRARREIRDFLAFGDAGDFLGFEGLDQVSGHLLVFQSRGFARGWGASREAAYKSGLLALVNSSA